ncbi:microfibril-associated glycoprotein 4-like [Megalops cyprinoides]|uniref:microfibril-associated glycoprotein 4-like n=1 Tax=Megalops cyprinoides TaxID=118141 RepID=UPI001864C474|nr:microfibril-associated glycoprotein 4-like [Megalops cyprinoides]
MKALAFLVLLLPVSAHCLMFQPLDCADIYNDGSQTSDVYRIYPAGPLSPVYVYCDMDTDGGKWTVIQRRMDGSVNFYRPWEQYKSGFGNAAGEYWLGLETMYLLNLRKKYELRVDMEDFEGGKVHAQYSSFSIDPESEGYTLHVTGYIDGGAGDSMANHDGSKFSTFDKDQDSSSFNCAKSYLGGFWYNNCHVANPNGLYQWGRGSENSIGINWKTWRGYEYSLKAIVMKIRPVSLALLEE